ncbi:MAG TPA: hypothetical protein VMG32_08500 [Anaeromyxobacteraceae bacterium]|nr:hypothetical protein [Anaeromyxobacteraceae bacterium]
MDDDRLDLSALDPKRDPDRFERMVKAVVAGVRPREARVHPLLLSLLGFGRMAVACAALLAAVAWVPALVRWREAGRTRRDRVALVSSWAEAGQIPKDADLFRTLEDSDGR